MLHPVAKSVMNERTRRIGLIGTFSYPLILLGFVLLVFIPICVFIVPEFRKCIVNSG